jgi:Tfp pilus assembly protein FimT
MEQFKKNLNKIGFTLVELLLSMSLVFIIVGFSIPVTKSFLDQNEFDVAFRFITGAVRKAHIYSMSGKNDSIWGYRIQSNTVIVFSGATYATRTTSLDEVSTFSDKISASGASEIVFAKVTGLPNTTGNVNISNTFKSKSISINSKGIVTY